MSVEEKSEPTLTNEVPLTSSENLAPSDTPQPMDISHDEPDTATITTMASPTDATPAPPNPPLSKNALKRLRRKQAWDDAKDDRRERRKEKRRNQKDRIRAERATLIAQGADPESFVKKPQPSSLVPVSIILDCDFERYMNLKERISLSSQVTRSYSDNKQARYRSHLWVAGFDGAIAQRFNEVLGGQHKAWKGVSFCEGDFLATAQQARERMKTNGGEMIEPLQKSLDEKPAWVKDEKDPFPMPDPAPPLDENNMDIVYLSSDSPYTLESLEPNTCYVVGGLVDKNREKGLCYRRARERGIRTARLPIGQFMVMQSRQVLATNHVVEIMLKWLECGDWGQAFLSVIPKRKGGKLKGADEAEADAEDGKVGAEDNEDEDEDGDEESAEPAGGANPEDESHQNKGVKSEEGEVMTNISS